MTPPQLATDAATLARGKHLVEAKYELPLTATGDLADQTFTDAPLSADNVQLDKQRGWRRQKLQ